MPDSECCSHGLPSLFVKGLASQQLANPHSLTSVTHLQPTIRKQPGGVSTLNLADYSRNLTPCCRRVSCPLWVRKHDGGGTAWPLPDSLAFMGDATPGRSMRSSRMS